MLRIRISRVLTEARFNNEFTLYLGRVLNQVYPNGSHILPVLILFGLLLMLALIIISCRRKEKACSFFIFVCICAYGNGSCVSRYTVCVSLSAGIHIYGKRFCP